MEDIISLFLALIVALITALRSAIRTMRVSWLRFCPLRLSFWRVSLWMTASGMSKRIDAQGSRAPRAVHL